MDWGTLLIKDFLPKTSYESESFFKGFILFFVTIELLLGTVTFLLYRIEVLNLKNRIFLEMKNYSYTFEGKKFEIELVSLEESKEGFYELLDTEKGLSILVPIPGSDRDALRIYYPRELFSEDLKGIILKSFFFFGALSAPAFLLSLLFSLYSIHPLRKALQIVDEVTKDIIHDLNTPLMTLRVNLKLLSAKYSDEEIERSLLALKQLETLKDHLRPLHVRSRLKFESVNLRTILEEEIKNLKRVYSTIRVIASLEDTFINTDAIALRRIVLNLLDNAFRHNTDDAWVEIVLRDRILTIKNPSRKIKHPQKLFERYYRESQRGLGLGLSIAKKLCAELGCEIQLEFDGKIFITRVTFK